MSFHQIVAERVDPTQDLGIHAPKMPGDCGFDLSAMGDFVIRPGQTVDVPVNCRIKLPPNTWAQMLARSSIAKLGLSVEAGIIDNGYRGPMFVVMRNVRPRVDVRGLTGSSIRIKDTQRIAQLVVHQLMPVALREGAVVEDTLRGSNGFGSTGTFA